jgi:hypothetical protein
MPENNRIGGLWKPKTENPNAPIAKGDIEIGGAKIRIAVWVNKWKKEGERTPDYHVTLDAYGEGSAPLQPGAAPQGRETATAPAQGVAQRTPLGAKPPAQSEFPDDIPF